MSKSPLNRLPDDVLFGIFSYCNGDDLREFSRVNRSFRAVAQDDYLWKTIYQERFNRDPSRQESMPYRKQYDHEDQLILCIAEECTIAHDRLPYWRRADDPRSAFGTVALLHAVSWLHVFGTLRGVHTGKYNVVWRMSAMPRAQNIFGIKFSAETRRRCRRSESQLPHSASLLEFGSDYFDFVLPKPIEITDPFEDVIVQCKCESHEWKTGITLCSVRLVLIEATTEGRARALGNSSIDLALLRFLSNFFLTRPDNR
ncbi:hypothetical protein GGH94_003204 [Coemansia aciculifera]|uniref:F-box domain-containing protein n=2 Tax=Coemansia TaxID=4863 RepID=A0A9W8M5A8_9FUNG|nr:hypothetical protein GGH94_003204 [Coemansia aciculifera]